MIAVLISLLALGPQTVDQRIPVPEGTTISSVDVSGFDIGRLSPGLREDIRALVGTALKQARLDELAARIEAERPRRVAAVRTIMETAGQARVVFIVGARDGEDDRNNVNRRYLVDHVEITGVPDSDLSETLRNDLQALVGKRLDSEQADTLQERIEQELPRYGVSRRISRGDTPGHIRVVFELRKKELPAWLRFEPLRADGIFHSEQGWGSFLTLGISTETSDIRFTPIVAIDNGDDLIEEYSGAGLRFEMRRMGTRRLGASFEWTTFEPTWRNATVAALAANPTIPTLYDTRTTVRPLVNFAISPELTISGGVGITELDPFVAGGAHRMANAAIGSIDFSRRLENKDEDQTHTIDARFLVRGGWRALESDLAYTRYLAQGSYRYDLGRHHVLATGMAGKITGDAPLFERFSLGDSVTLRGWDKYDIAPTGGSRVFHASVEYRYSVVSVFLDLGSVWDTPAEKKTRVSTGIGFHGGTSFAELSFPLNTDNLSAIFTFGLRFSEKAFRW
jgi:Omp85 superfamily domain